MRTYEQTAKVLQGLGHEVRFVTPASFRTIPCPTYPDIPLALAPRPGVRRLLESFDPDAVHVATEGPLGQAAHGILRRAGLPFTTSYHTQFAEYIRARIPIPVDWTYRYLRRFHRCAVRTMVPSESLRRRLESRGFENLAIWSRGVDIELFRPRRKDFISAPRPVAMYVGRVAVEKNIEAFLALDLPGSKFVVGDGPDLAKLRRRYTGVRFTGLKTGEELARLLGAADVFVFPSLTDTFGLVMLEAMACGVPVAAFPVTGPIDIVRDGVTGILDEDLRKATLAALDLEPRACIDFARARSWDVCSETFLSLLSPWRATGESEARLLAERIVG